MSIDWLRGPAMAALLAGLCACGDAAELGADAGSPGPIAHAGSDDIVSVGGRAQLDGSRSSGRGLALSYQWAITTAPAGSVAGLSSATIARPSFVPDRAGVYEVTLVVATTAGESSPDRVRVTALNAPPTVSAGNDAAVYTGETATLAATAHDPDGAPLTVMWTVAARPPGSTAVPASATSLSTTFTPDVAGEYVLAVAVGDGQTVVSDSATVVARPPLLHLAGRALDAEYSDALDAIVYVSEQPDRLYVLRMPSGASSFVALPLPASSVSVSPDGLTAAVGHDGYISIVRLADAVREATHPVSCVVGDVVLAANGYAYAFPQIDQWVALHSLAIATGAESRTGDFAINAGTRARLHPAGRSVYGADNGLLPSDIEHYDISGGPAVVLRDSPYHGDHEMCGDLWLSQDGARIFTRCGNVFRATENAVTDMTYNGSLSMNDIVTSLDHSSDAGKIVAVSGVPWFAEPDDVAFHVYDDAFLAYERTVLEPEFRVGSTFFRGESRFVFFSADGSRVYLVTQAPGEAALLEDFGVATYAM
jgi:hypothetical protein